MIRFDADVGRTLEPAQRREWLETRRHRRLRLKHHQRLSYPQIPWTSGLSDQASGGRIRSALQVCTEPAAFSLPALSTAIFPGLTRVRQLREVVVLFGKLLSIDGRISPV